MALSRLVLLPGMDGTGELFRPFLNGLPPGISTSIVTYPRDRIVPYRDLHAFLEASVPQGEAYVLVAESFSGPLALDHAARKPVDLRGLVLCASFASIPLSRSIRWLRPVVHLAAYLSPPPRWMVRRLLLGRDSPEESVEALRTTISSVSRKVLAARIRQVMAMDFSTALKAIEVPVLYLAAKRDRLVGQRGLEQLKNGVVALSSSVIDGPHLLLQARPEEAALRIVEFLEGEAVA
jgi:pimeloyl-[acyl-carrier protein] methyl ester esterase